MANRNRNATIWKDPFYRALPPLYKCLWDYINDDCDNAGVWIPDFKVASICIGRRVTPEKAIGFFAPKITVLEGNNWLIKSFIAEKLCFTELKPTDRFQKSIIELLNKHKLQLNKGHTSPLQGANTYTEVKERTEVKEEEGVVGGIEDNLQTAFDPIYLEQLRMKWQQVDFDFEYSAFLDKVRGSPSHYMHHDTGGLRLALQSQLRGAKKINGTKRKVAFKL